MIEVENLTRKYGSFVAVDDISFSIPQGQIVGLLGHNGAGKSTTMKVLTGYLEPTAGRVSIDGLDIEQNRLEVQRKIGYLPEVSPVYPEMSVIEYLNYVADLREIPVERKSGSVRDAIDKTGLLEKATAYINTLSKGFKQRVGVAQAIIHDPDILILDEPTSGLDPSQIHEMRGLVKELSQHATVILSTHILQEVEAICDRVIIILRGKVAIDSKLDELQHSNRLLLSINKKPEAVEASLKGLSGVESVSVLDASNGHTQYALDLAGEVDATSSEVAKFVVEKGWDLYSLRPEQRDLEAVFREINRA